MVSGGKLTVKQEKFCDKYLECGNASEAYRFAYDSSNMSDDTLWKRACELMQNGNVAGRIKELQHKLEEKNIITKERILAELAAILDAQISDYVDLVTKKVPVRQTKRQIEANAPIQYIEVQDLVFKDFSQLSDKQIRAIESIKQGRNGIELKLHGKSWTIERICKMLGYDAPEKREIAGKDGERLALTIEVAGEKTRDEIEKIAQRRG